jgi:hypothetical protein
MQAFSRWLGGKLLDRPRMVFNTRVRLVCVRKTRPASTWSCRRGVGIRVRAHCFILKNNPQVRRISFRFLGEEGSLCAESHICKRSLHSRTVIHTHLKLWNVQRCPTRIVVNDVSIGTFINYLDSSKSVCTTTLRSFASKRSGVSKQDCAGTPSARQPLRKAH